MCWAKLYLLMKQWLQYMYTLSTFFPPWRLRQGTGIPSMVWLLKLHWLQIRVGRSGSILWIKYRCLRRLLLSKSSRSRWGQGRVILLWFWFVCSLTRKRKTNWDIQCFCDQLLSFWLILLHYLPDLCLFNWSHNFCVGFCSPKKWPKNWVSNASSRIFLRQKFIQVTQLVSLRNLRIQLYTPNWIHTITKVHIYIRSEGV